jgi:hypothetical protein
MRRSWLLGAVATVALTGLVLLGQQATVRAADHGDSPAAKKNPLADINDVLAWMSSDASKLNLAMTVFPNATSGASFDTATQYVFHINSKPSFLDTAAPAKTQVICQFYTTSKIECWAGGEYVEGDPSQSAGLTSASGKMRVYAGLRDDPFYFEGAGFGETVKAVIAAAPSLTFDKDGCPALDTATATALVTQLQSGVKTGGTLPPASDSFGGQNVLAIVVQLDKTLVNSKGDILGVWGSTHR